MNSKKLKLKNVLDLETTGLDATRDDITEISLLKVDKEYNVIKELHYFLKPKHSIHSSITKLTGLDNESLENCKCFEDIKFELLEFLASDDIYAYGKLDERFLKKKVYLDNRFIDVLQIIRSRYRHFKNCKFKTICNAFKIKNLREHSAKYDSIALAQLMEKMKL